MPIAESIGSIRPNESINAPLPAPATAQLAGGTNQHAGQARSTNGATPAEAAVKIVCSPTLLVGEEQTGRLDNLIAALGTATNRPARYTEYLLDHDPTVKDVVSKSDELFVRCSDLIICQRLQVGAHQYRLLNQIGRGAYGLVKAAVSAKDNKLFAIKVSQPMPAGYADSVEREAEVLRALGPSRHLIKFIHGEWLPGKRRYALVSFGISSVDAIWLKVFQVMEYGGCNLEEYSRDQFLTRTSFTPIYSIAEQVSRLSRLNLQGANVCLAACCWHTMGACPRLLTQYVVLNMSQTRLTFGLRSGYRGPQRMKDFRPVLIDFGLAREISKGVERVHMVSQICVYRFYNSADSPSTAWCRQLYGTSVLIHSWSG